jgi:mRNA-degrading endonuclease RelE of RelBE toxin-antitoxin system
MKRIIVYSPEAEKWLTCCTPIIRDRIMSKIEYFSKQENIYAYAKKLSDSSLYRFRIGPYRVTFRNRGPIIDIAVIGKRSEVYR